ncbi:hypothetical protein Zm00014a_041027 [Zea mays]|uniref:Uncharacterized protein n=1 Tax=Zea mays TaxID=4577 RepID=A0A3L6G5U5_MAIZE|nr:hypothetical protein Zm00014a_041027 [Zea mays]
MLLTGASALCWAIWLTRNDSVFDKRKPKSYLEVLFRETHWLRSWAQLQRMDEQRQELVQVCHHLGSRAMDFFASRGWPFLFRLSC